MGPMGAAAMYAVAADARPLNCRTSCNYSADVLLPDEVRDLLMLINFRYAAGLKCMCEDGIAWVRLDGGGATGLPM